MGFKPKRLFAGLAGVSAILAAVAIAQASGPLSVAAERAAARLRAIDPEGELIRAANDIQAARSFYEEGLLLLRQGDAEATEVVLRRARDALNDAGDHLENAIGSVDFSGSQLDVIASFVFLSSQQNLSPVSLAESLAETTRALAANIELLLVENASDEALLAVRFALDDLSTAMLAAVGYDLSRL